ncbi:MAG: hypothetical protein KC731_07220, partial [Myxococcales bacterium]|nr:hypothetical protein [Myxococcales bacterium]
LYPEELGVQVKALRDLEEEHGSLEALRDGFLTAPGGMITHRGRMMRPKDLDEAIDVVAAEREAAKRALRAHDQACRTACRAAARAIGEGWDKYLHSLVRLLHYATHLEANVSDAAGHLANVWAVVSADRRITDAELRRLVVAGDEVHRALEEIDRQRTEVVLPEALKQRLEVESWSAVIGEELRLPPPAHHNMGDWLGVVDSWIGAFEGALGALRRTTLDLLLEVEGRVVAMYRGEVEVEPAPQRARVPKHYTTMLEGQERPRQTKLDWWDRFQTADGLVPSVARFAVAGAIVGAVLAAGGMVGAPEAVIYNGLERSVVVELGREVVELAPQQRRKVELPAGARVAIKATTTDGQLIEAFDADFDTSFGTYVYNVAGASPLVEWTAHYGTASP